MTGFTLAIPQSVENLQLPAPELLNYYKNYEDRVYWVEGEIDETITDLTKMIIECNRQDKELVASERKPIKIFITSCGGLLDETMALVKLIGISKTPIITINACYAYSAASLILIAGHKRYAMPGTKCLFHSGSSTMGSATFEQVQAATEDYKKLVKQMQDYILSKTKIDSKLFNKKKAYDWYLNIDEMIEHGVVDKIIDDIDEII
jgi:ATP-dependent protease ClpP protease subunit